MAATEKVIQELEQIDLEPWDVRLDYIATDHELIDCNPEAHA